jgi:hypothetical protein
MIAHHNVQTCKYCYLIMTKYHHIQYREELCNENTTILVNIEETAEMLTIRIIQKNGFANCCMIEILFLTLRTENKFQGV